MKMFKKILCVAALCLLGTVVMAEEGDSGFDPSTILGSATTTIGTVVTAIGSLLAAAVGVYLAFVGYRKAREALNKA